MEKIKSRITEFFNKGDKRTLQAKKNIVASFLIKGVSIAVNLILVPLTINYVNPTQYGIWLTLSSFVAWFSFFDIGFGNGLRNKFAEARAIGDNDTARIYVSTTYFAVGILFGIVWLLFVLINRFLDWSFLLNAPLEMSDELTKVSLIVFSFFCLQIVLRLISTILVADQKNAKAGFLEMLGQIGALAIIYVLTQVSEGSLLKLAISIGIAPVMVFLISSYVLFRGELKDFRPSLKYVRLTHINEILKLGLQFFIIQVSAVVLFQTTNIIVAQLLNPLSVTVYNITYKYIYMISMVFAIIIAPFWSAFTEAFIKKDYLWMKSTFAKLQQIWVYLIPVVVVMLVISGKVYELWIGNKVQIPFHITLLMAVNVLFSTRLSIFISIINGIGKVRMQLMVNVILSILFIPTAIFVTKYWGLPGIIVANVLVALVHAVIGQIQVHKLINQHDSGIWSK